MTTPYHSQYWAHALTLQGAADNVANLARSIANARVELKPHQVDAALFALRSPFSQGAILADEVGLGKTIEASIVIAQRWAERRRRILLIVPATLRTQWQQELAEKFYLPALVLDSKAAKTLQKEGVINPFTPADQIVICSYHYASRNKRLIAQVPWDLVVIDEAHRLRNVYQKSSKLARNIADALTKTPKLLLTATPLQNSLVELYGLVSMVDPHFFGDLRSFRAQYVQHNGSSRDEELRRRLAAICQRTLRKQVTAYVPFTQRRPLTWEFHADDAEQELYEAVSEYLRNDDLIALPSSQRKLLTLVLRKLLASSTFAIAGTLDRLVVRLEALQQARDHLDQTADLAEDFSGFSELADEYAEQEEAESATDEAPADAEPEIDPEVLERAQSIDPAQLAKELAELRSFAQKAAAIGTNAKGEKLLASLDSALHEATKLGAARKAVIFTESRRTQQYLFDLLNKQGYAGKVVMINGVNDDPLSRQIYQAWQAENATSDRRTGSKTVDMKTAIIDHFRGPAELLIATEAAAEGVNLQFCSLVINYDLPWNPQRVEQRIGRCHRYGQKHDVLVVNFVNLRNAADKRVYELLREKFHLFDGIFGASDEVLGALESGVDIERRIVEIYQTCRDEAAIMAAFDALQASLEEEIQTRMAGTRQALLEHVDEEVNRRLQLHQAHTIAALDQQSRWLLALTRAELGSKANVQFDPTEPRFFYWGDLPVPSGYYHLDWQRAAERRDHFYRTDHPLAQQVLTTAKARRLPTTTLHFDYDGYGARVSALEPFRGKTGWLQVAKVTVQSVAAEEFLVLVAQTDGGTLLDGELAAKLLELPATVDKKAGAQKPAFLDAPRTAAITQQLATIEARNADFYEEETHKLDQWAEDLKFGLEQEIRELDKAIKAAKRGTKAGVTLAEKIAAEREANELERQRNRKRRELFAEQDRIEAQRDGLLAQIERQLVMTHEVTVLFTVRWGLQ